MIAPKRFLQIAVFSGGFILAVAGMTVAASEHCAPGCDCKTPTASTKACDTSSVCTDVEATKDEKNMYHCADARHREGDFPSDCKDNVVYSTDEDGNTVANWGNTNCNKPAEHCSIPCLCQVVEATLACEEMAGTQSGTWSNVEKPTEKTCDTKY